jgi:branched-chain amino acid aminotransferase
MPKFAIASGIKSVNIYLLSVIERVINMTDERFIWKNGIIMPWEQVTTHVLTHGLHYGSAVFEGIRCYKTQAGLAIFKLKEHIDRFFYSAKQLGMKLNFTQLEICQAVIETVRKHRNEECYIRPLAYYGYGSMKVVPALDLPVDIVIACWPWGEYLPVAAVDVAISPFIRIHPKSTVADAKISGHYVNSILAGLAIRNTHYHEALLLDAEGFVAEGSAENIFIVKNGKLITTPRGTILVGITRDTVIDIAKQMGFEVEERPFNVDEIYTAEEAFFTGTAVEVTAIRSLADQLIGQEEIGPVTRQIITEFQKVVRGHNPNYQSSLTFVNKAEEVATV